MPPNPDRRRLRRVVQHRAPPCLRHPRGTDDERERDAGGLRRVCPSLRGPPRRACSRRRASRSVMTCWTAADDALLLRLLELSTVTPMESDAEAGLSEALSTYAYAANRCGLEVAYRLVPSAHALESAMVPVSVAARAQEVGPSFFASQPSIVLTLGPRLSARQTIVFNVH